APSAVPVRVLNLNVSDGCGFLTGAQCMFAVVNDFKAWHSGRGEAMNQSRQGAVSPAGKLDRLAVSGEQGFTGDHPVLAFRSEALELPRTHAFNVLAPEHRLQFCRLHFTAETVHLVVGDRAEVTLHFLGKPNPELRFEQVGDAALAGLAIDANHF